MGRCSCSFYGHRNFACVIMCWLFLLLLSAVLNAATIDARGARRPKTLQQPGHAAAAAAAGADRRADASAALFAGLPKPTDGGRATELPEVRVRVFESAFTPAECEQVEVMAGKAARGGIKKGVTYSGGTAAAEGTLRSTALRWLPRTETSHWLYDRVLALAQKADDAAAGHPVAPWGYAGRDSGGVELQELQLGIYSAEDDPPGHYDWHADEEHEQQVPPAASLLCCTHGHPQTLRRMPAPIRRPCIQPTISDS